MWKNDSICSLHFQYFLEKELNILSTKTAVMYQWYNILYQFFVSITFRVNSFIENLIPLLLYKILHPFNHAIFSQFQLSHISLTFYKLNPIKWHVVRFSNPVKSINFSTILFVLLLTWNGFFFFEWMNETSQVD